MPIKEQWGLLLIAAQRDHGGGIDAAASKFGGSRFDWIDLSTGINPVAYPLPSLPQDVWKGLPDKAAHEKLYAAARAFWDIPQDAAIVAASGASALISGIPRLTDRAGVVIPGPTYNEHAAAFKAGGWQVAESGRAQAQVVVHPNNPDGHLWAADDLPSETAPLTVIDESFCDTIPDRSLMEMATRPGTLVLKSFGKFWGLAGARLGFAVGDPGFVAALQEHLGPWAVSGPALHIGAAALEDPEWAHQTRQRLSSDSARLDGLMSSYGAQIVGGTTLFRLYRVPDAHLWQDRLARHHIWSRIFPYNAEWLRLGLPHPSQWDRLEAALTQ